MCCLGPSKLNYISFPTGELCAFTAKKTRYYVSSRVKDTLLKNSGRIGILGVDISDNNLFRSPVSRPERKVKLASKILNVLSTAKQYFIRHKQYFEKPDYFTWCTVSISWS